MNRRGLLARLVGAGDNNRSVNLADRWFKVALGFVLLLGIVMLLGAL